MRFANAVAWHAEQLAGEFQRRGHEVLLMCLRDSPLAQRAAGASFAVNREMRPTHFSPVEVYRSVTGVRRALAEFSPDILNPHCAPGHSYLALTRALGNGGPALVRTVAEPRSPRRHGLNRRLYFKQTDGLIFTTQSSALRYRDAWGDLPQSCTVILPGFQAETFVAGASSRDLRRELGIAADVLLIGIIARMSPEKGQEILIQALTKLPAAERHRVHVVLAGEDSRERGQNDLRQVARAEGVAEQMTFLSKLEDVRPVMRALDVGLITSTRSEAICRVALEYMSMGLPVIASDTNILPEVVTAGETGWIFANEDAEALANILGEAIQNRAELKRRGAAGARAVRAQFTLAHEADRYLEIFATAQAGREKRA